MSRHLSGAEPVVVDGFGVGLLVDRAFRPDGWDGEPLYLVLVERGKDRRAVALGCLPETVRQTGQDAPKGLVDESWTFRKGGKQR